MANITKLANFIWGAADPLRGDYKQLDYGKVVLPFTVLRRLDCVIEPTKKKVLDYLPRIKGMNIKNAYPIINKVAGLNFHNKTKFDFEKLKVFIPSLKEQKTISLFLDNKVLEMDDLIEKKNKQTELLKSQKVSIINHIITKGLNN